MTYKSRSHILINYLIAIVWIVNGLFCKVLNFVPRHQQIVARILGNSNAAVFTKSIGLSEILMAVWILSLIKPKFCITVQIIIIALMNAIEFFLVPDLLLFGRINSLIALIFIVSIYLNEFVLNNNPIQT